MGLLSKILGASGKKAESAAADFLKDVMKKVGEQTEQRKAAAPAPAKTEAPAAASEPAAEERSDSLWGEIMPKDENQFSFNGTYKAYFEQIFRTEFAAYPFTLTHSQYYDSDVYSFTKNGEKVLVVELMRTNCDATKLRRDTLRAGVPYLRLYIDCSEIGWWNARTYVVDRIRKAIG